MTRRALPPDLTLIERQEEVDALSARCRREGRFAFDTEFVMEDRYESEVCLIQLAVQGTVALIDPFLKLDLAPIWDMVCDPQVQAVAHAGQEDLALCVQHTGRVPHNVFDVQIAAGLAGLDYPMSLQRLVQSTLHVRLHKSKTLTNWRKRPLTGEQVRYAAEDVSYLLGVQDELVKRLTRLERRDWAQEEFRRFEDMTVYRRAEVDKVQRIKGAGSLKGQQLSVLHRLWAWREEVALRMNRPARIALKDHLMVEIARQSLTSFADIRDLRGVNLSDRDVHALCGVVKEALTIPEEAWPKSKPHDVETPWESSLIALCTAVIRSYCLDHDLAYSLVATQRSIKELIRHRTQGKPAQESDVELLCGWRRETVGAMLDDVLAGRRAVRVAPVNGEPTVHVTVAERGAGV